jgi:hypothetical protein
MQLRQDYPYSEALNDFENFIDKQVVHQYMKDEFKEIIDSSRQKKTVPMRGLQDKLMKYRKKYSLYTPFTPEEREMMDDLIHFWC